MLRSFQLFAAFKTKKITKVILAVLSRDFLTYWELQASENLLEVGSPQPRDIKTKGADRLKITLESASLPETEVIIRGDVTGDEVISLLQLLKNRSSGKLVLYKEDEQYIVDVQDIVFLETSGSKVTVCTQNQTYEAKQKLYELKELLAAFSFAQINKSTLVNISHVKCIQAEFSGNYLIKLKTRKDILTISRKYFKEFKDRI